MIGGIKSSPKELKFWGDKDDDFKSTSPKDLNESPHGLRGIERNRSKSVVFSRTQKLRFVETRDSGGCSTRLDGIGSLQGVTKSSRSSPSSRAQELAKENRISTKRDTRWTKLNRSQNPGGHKEGRASFPIKSQYKNLNQSIPGWMGADQNFFRNRSVGLYPKNHHKLSSPRWSVE